MSKITQITVVDENTLRLEVDAKKGDEIDLLSLNEFDLSHVRKLIEEGKDKEYQKRLKEEENKFNLQLQKDLLERENKIKNEFLKQIDEYKTQISTLTTELKNIKESIDDKSKLKAAEEVKEYLEKINKLEQEKTSLKNEFELKIVKLEYEIKDLNNQKDAVQKEKDQEYKQKILELQNEHTNKIHEKDNEIIRLQNDRTTLNIKRIGENLEKWCDNEVTAYSQTGFINSVWEKDNTAIKEDGEAKGTKADFIFRVYSDSSHKFELTSVACEMKSEDPTSKNQKKNADHYNKLDKDRIKKKCEYALLVSELEWDQANDVPIKKVLGFEKMYLVRPQYFIPFLSLIEGLANKYKELLVETEKEALMFEETNKILKDFETFKEELINKLLARIIKSVNDIDKQANNIKKAADEILSTTYNIVNTQITAVVNKIEKFNIKSLTKKIDKLEE